MTARAGQVAVVVVLHNSAATLQSCLQRVAEQPEVAEILLVDNASTDCWRDLLPDDRRIRVLGNPDNPGFAVACNQGAAVAHSEWILFLNPDCLLYPGALATLLAVAREQGGAGLLGAQLLESNGQPQAASRRLAPTPARLLGGLGRLTALAAADRAARGCEPGSPALDPCYFESVEAVSGALMLLPRPLFEAVAGFDEAYRLHCEDLDLCRRVIEHGAWVGIAPLVRVIHIKGTSSQRRPFWVEWQKHRGMWRYYSKFDRARSPWWISLLVAMGLALHYPQAALRAAWRARLAPAAAGCAAAAEAGRPT